MATEVGSAYVSIIPSATNIGPAMRKQILPAANKVGTEAGSGIARGIDGRLRDARGKFVSEGGKTGKAVGRSFGSSFGLGLRGVGGPLAALGLAGLVKSSVTTEAQFSQTMATLAATAKVPQQELAGLSALAIQMGRDTVFSASEAANAMLELAKGGLSAAKIQAGGLQETLTLAAASGTDMATAATIMSNAMNTFELSAKDAPKITAALAGGANASTASIESLGEALQQVGPGALNAGLSVQETVAALAAFDNAGIKGSDAGTSLKTMLARLVPQTDKAAGAMRDLGLDFTNANGNFIPLTKIAGQLAKALGPLNDAARTKALNRIFGSDASRAASVLANEGVKGLRSYIKATNDSNAAQQIAAARMSGTAGAIEQLRGSIETAKLRFGTFIQPHVIRAAQELTRAINGQSPAVNTLVAALKPAAQILQAVFSTVRGLPAPLLAAAAAMVLFHKATSLAGTRLSTFAANVRTARQGAGLFRTGLSGVMGMFGGPWGLALAGGAAALGVYAAKQAAAKARVAELTGTLNTQTGAITKNTRALVVQNLERSGVLAQARKLGLSLNLVTDAALGNAAAQRQVNAVTSAYLATLPKAGGLTASRTGANVQLTKSQRELKNATTIVTGAITLQNTELRKAQQAALRTAEAMGVLAAARQKATKGLIRDLQQAGAATAVAIGTANKIITSRTGGGFAAAGSGDTIIVNNPIPEPASESVPKAIERKKRRQAVPVP